MSEIFDPYHEWLGIPAAEQPASYYRLLGIPVLETSLSVIDNAANQRMAYLRTFQSGKHVAESQHLLNEVAAARVCLLNAAKKATYDEELRKRLAQKRASSWPNRPSRVWTNFSRCRLRQAPPIQAGEAAHRQSLKAARSCCDPARRCSSLRLQLWPRSSWPVSH